MPVRRRKSTASFATMASNIAKSKGKNLLDKKDENKDENKDEKKNNRK